MKQLAAKSLSLLWLVLPLLTGGGCVSANVNPATPKANLAYVDFYPKDHEPVAWSVQQFDAGANQFRKLFWDAQPPQEGILRLALPPGNHRLQVSILNRIVLDPVVIEIAAVAGRVTPVEVQLSAAGTALVRTTETRRGPTYRGRYGRATSVDYFESHPLQIRAEAQPTQPYQRKERMAYYESNNSR